MLTTEEDRFENLYREFRALVFTICLSRLGNIEEAEDATIEAFTLAHRNFEKYDPQRPFKAWISTIAVHHCISVLRRRRLEMQRQTEINNSPSLPSSDPQTPLHLILSHCLSNLCAEDRVLLLDKFVEGYTLEEMAQMRSTPEKGVSEWDMRVALKAIKEQFIRCLEANGITAKK